MTEIPEDIREKAEGVFEYWMKTADTVISELIALAILAERQSATAAERERCAKIAEEYALGINGDDYGKGGYERAFEIAVAIRESER